MLGRPQAEPSEMGYGTYVDTVNALESALTPGPYILRDRFSAADVFVGSQIGHRMMTKSLEPRPIFQSYYARLSERPAFKRTKEQTEKLVAQLRAAG
jgi:glutathione S-transferase